MTKMQRHVVFEIEQLVDIVKGRINIYGAKSRALCLKKYLQNHGIEIESFLVSKDYDNPECLDGINVKKIEDRPLYKYGCLIIAVGLQYIYDIEKYIDKYDIEVLVIIDPSITTFPSVQVVSDESVISEKTYIIWNGK